MNVWNTGYCQTKELTQTCTHTYTHTTSNTKLNTKFLTGILGNYMDVKYIFSTPNHISYFLLCLIHFQFVFFLCPTRFKTILCSHAHHETSCHVKYRFPTPNHISYFLLCSIDFWFAFLLCVNLFKNISFFTRPSSNVIQCKIYVTRHSNTCY